MNDYIKDIDKVLQSFANKAVSEFKTELSWTNNLKNNIKYKISDNKLELIMPDYAVFVEYGRKPGKQPPLNAIYKWCESKGIPTGAAYPIARKIGKEGMEPKPFLHSIDDEKGDLLKDIAKLLVNNIVESIEDK